MKIRKRLILSNISVVIIPVAAAALFTIALYSILTGVFGQQTGYKTISDFIRLQYEFISDDARPAADDPESILDPVYQRYMASRAEKYGADVVVFKGDEPVFRTDSLNFQTVEYIRKSSKNALYGTFVDTEAGQFAVRAAGVELRDGSVAELLLFMRVEGNALNLLVLLIFGVCIFIAAFIAVNIWNAVTLSDNIIKPLVKLKSAAAEIGKGNTGFEITEEGDDEVRELCRAYDNMRKRLKDSDEVGKKLEENRKMIVSSISHDLKTPITAIKGYVEGILDGVADSREKMEKYLRTIRAKAEVMDVMIDDLMLYSLFDSAQIKFKLEETDVVAFFSDFADDCRQELLLSGMEIEVVKPDWQAEGVGVGLGPVFVLMDREKMSRVAVNITDNSRKFMNRPDGRIIVSFRLTPGSIIIEIADNGPGIPKSDMPKIFDRFYRADVSRGGNGGSGIGLAIAKQIVEGHGGKIWAGGNDFGGTSIMISLPRHAGPGRSRVGDEQGSNR